MRPQNIVIALAVLAGGVGLTAVAERPAAPVRQAIAIQQVALPEFDFTALHRQASEALDNLRRAQQRGTQTGAAVN